MGITVRKAHETPHASTDNLRAQSASIELDRTGDDVYHSTTNIVKSIMAMLKEVRQNKHADNLELVKAVGGELRILLASVDSVIHTLPVSAHSNIEMAHKVLSSDMAKLIASMKTAQKYSNTTMAEEYKKGMLKAAHALAMDSKHLLDAVDSGRKLLLLQN